MDKLTAEFPTARKQTTASVKLPTGRLLIDDADEILYANTQARHFLGLLTDEMLPRGQKFLQLVRAAYQCSPPLAWMDWPRHSGRSPSRYLIYTPPNGQGHLLLKVEIAEHIRLEGKDIWAITIKSVESKFATAVSQLTI